MIIAPHRILQLLHHHNNFLQAFDGSILGQQNDVVLFSMSGSGPVGDLDPGLGRKMQPVEAAIR
ncbi:hypothetical protein D3C75_983210 [compost metagenome]